MGELPWHKPFTNGPRWHLTCKACGWAGWVRYTDPWTCPVDARHKPIRVQSAAAVERRSAEDGWAQPVDSVE